MSHIPQTNAQWHAMRAEHEYIKRKARVAGGKGKGIFNANFTPRRLGRSHSDPYNYIIPKNTTQSKVNKHTTNRIYPQLGRSSTMSPARLTRKKSTYNSTNMYKPPSSSRRPRRSSSKTLKAGSPPYRRSKTPSPRRKSRKNVIY